MYINIGDKAIRKKDIVAIFDMDSSTVSVNTRNFLAKKQEERLVIPCGYELPKSFVLTVDGNVYLSQFNSAVLKHSTCARENL